MFKKKTIDPKIYPEDVFMDSENISGFDTSQFEGRLEKPLNRKTFAYFSFALGIMAMFFLARIFYLQILEGEKFAQRSEKNSLKKEVIMPLRGIIYDRNKIKLAWNGESGRVYVPLPGLSHVLGYMGAPSVGKSGAEKEYEKILRGETGIKLTETDSQGAIVSESVQEPPQDGKNLNIAVDSRIQSQFFKLIESAAKERGFQGGAGVIIDIRNGGALSLVSWPEYDSQTLSDGAPAENIERFIKNKNKPFLNRAVAGLYAPGSIIKPLIALAALNEGIISPQKQIFSSGSISIPNPFFKDKKTVFRDWRAHGWVDMRRALAVSSDVYFYEVGGGFEDIKGLGINKIKEYAEIFGFGSTTSIDIGGEIAGMVPSQELKAKNNPDDPLWRVGDTYNASIGQGYFLVTPIEIAVYTAAIASNGEMIKPCLRLAATERPCGQSVAADIPESYFKIVKEGMRMAVTEGTAQGLNIPVAFIAAKTGTAEIGDKKYVNSWVIGFFPYENPKYAFVLVLEKGPTGNLIGAPFVMRQLFDWMAINTPEYFVD